MNTIKTGMTIYSYCYGPMTVKQVDENHVIASVDKPEGFSPKFASICAGKNLDNIKFMTAAFGHWYFATAAEINAKKENNNFPEAKLQSGNPQAMTRDEDLLHASFAKETYPIDKNPGGETYPISKKQETYPIAK